MCVFAQKLCLNWLARQGFPMSRMFLGPWSLRCLTTYGGVCLICQDNYRNNSSLVYPTYKAELGKNEIWKTSLYWVLTWLLHKNLDNIYNITGTWDKSLRNKNILTATGVVSSALLDPSNQHLNANFCWLLWQYKLPMGVHSSTHSKYLPDFCPFSISLTNFWTVFLLIFLRYFFPEIINMIVPLSVRHYAWIPSYSSHLQLSYHLFNPSTHPPFFLSLDILWDSPLWMLSQLNSI